MKKILVILGPTAIGKTNLAIYLAKKFNGEMVACDSRQVYTGLDIGTGKMPGDGKWEVRRGREFWEIGGIRVWMYDVVSPKKQYTVADYAEDASRVAREVMERGKLPIVVGGTGLYLKALLEGLPNLAIPVDKNLRKKLQRLSKKDLQERLKNLSVKRWNNLNGSDKENPRRLVRAIELILSQKLNSPSGARRQNYNLKVKSKKLDILKIGLTAPREVLYKKVDERVVARIKQGMIKEAKKLHKSGLSLKRMRQLGLEYGALADYLVGKIKNQDELVKIMQNKIHGYVRRQMTWFKNPSTSSGSIHWFDITSKNYLVNVENLVTRWYYQS